MDHVKLRDKYFKFEYSKYNFELVNNKLPITFEYNISEKIYFQHKVIFEVDIRDKNKIYTPEFSNLVFHLGIAEMFSYWKATCSPLIIITAGYLNDEQIDWWEDLLVKGMGQYFYENRIDFTPNNFLNITSLKRVAKGDPAQVEGEKTLIPLGGGKDSVVTLEILVRSDLIQNAVLVVQPTTSYSAKVIEKSGILDSISVSRELDPELFKLNSLGFLNGHVPYTNVLFLISLISAYLGGYKNIVFSNEKSSDEGNINYLNKSINHQYSKTFEFENKIREYNHKYLSNVELFSFLRPLYDIQIAKIFSRHDKFFEIIRSCNIGQKAGVWCCNCPKCLSTFILLFPFTGPSKILKIFPRNLYEHENLSNILDNLISESKVKPFECVGTREELRVGLFLSLDQYKDGNLPKLLKYANNKYLKDKKALLDMAGKLLNNWDDNNNLPANFSAILRKEL